MKPVKPIIPPFPQLPPNLIQFKTMVVSEGLVITHDLGVVDVKVKDLFAINGDPALSTSYHPDLVEAAMTSVRELARKYNGEPNEANNQTDLSEASGQAGQQQADGFAEGQSRNADEEAGQINTLGSAT
jgi:hypothetical protein